MEEGGRSPPFHWLKGVDGAPKGRCSSDQGLWCACSIWEGNLWVCQ